MNISDVIIPCKTKVFKDVVSDLMYSFRASFKRLTEMNIDISLGRIRTTSISSNGCVLIEGRVINLVGGKVTCALDKNIIEYLQKPMKNFFKESLEYDDIINMFVDDIFDNFSNISKNGIFKISLNENGLRNDWEKNIYYIQYDLKLKTDINKTINSKVIFGIDELTALYFRD